MIQKVKKKKKSKFGEWRIGGCVWCKRMIVIFTVDQGTYDSALKEHVLYDCTFHPMRKMERKIKLLEKRLKDN